MLCSESWKICFISSWTEAFKSFMLEEKFSCTRLASAYKLQRWASEALKLLVKLMLIIMFQIDGFALWKSNTWTRGREAHLSHQFTICLGKFTVYEIWEGNASYSRAFDAINNSNESEILFIFMRLFSLHIFSWSSILILTKTFSQQAIALRIVFLKSHDSDVKSKVEQTGCRLNHFVKYREIPSAWISVCSSRWVAKTTCDGNETWESYTDLHLIATSIKLNAFMN